MIEIGQKFICVKYCYVYSDNKGDDGYNEGDIIEIKKRPVYISDFDYYYSCLFLNRKSSDSRLILIEEEEIKNYFMPLAEWREIQIKSVIDD